MASSEAILDAAGSCGSDAEVVKWLSEGLGRPKIAKQLSITEGMVESRIAKLLAKLGVLREVEA